MNERESAKIVSDVINTDGNSFLNYTTVMLFSLKKLVEIW